MKHFALVLALLVCGTLAWAADPQPYDEAAIDGIMSSNSAEVQAVKKGIEAGDWTSVAHSFIQFSQNAEKALTYAPPKGDVSDWQKIWTNFKFEAYQGVGAAGEKDAAKAKAALNQLLGDRGKGHREFRG